tara:strand:- start:6652 stop:8451 length:1800 start_codon:yes stop_codon:yes gene_type:complete
MDLSTSYTIKAKVEGQNQIGKLETGLNKLKVSTNKTATAMSKLKTAAGNAFGVLKGIAPVLGVAAIGKMVNDTLQLGDSLEKMSQKTGVAVPVLDKLRQAADLGGTEFKTLSRAFPTLAKNMQDASDGVGTAKEAFDRLGLGVTNADGSLKSLDTMFFEITDKIKNMNNRTLAAANASEIFGTGMGAKLIPIMNQGSEAIEALKTSFDQELAERMATFNDSVSQLGERFKILRTELTKLLLEALEKIVEVLTDLVDRFLELPEPVQKTIGVVVLLGSALAIVAPAAFTLVTALAALVVSFKIIAKIKIATVLAGIVAKFALLKAGVIAGAAAFAPFLPGALISAAIIGLGVLIFKFKDQIIGGFEAAGEFIVNFFIGVKESIGNIINNIAEFLKPFTDFIGNIFNKAMDIAKNAFDRLPNIVKIAIRAALRPFDLLISAVKGALNLIAKLRGEQSALATTNIATTPTTTASTTTSTAVNSSSQTQSLDDILAALPKTDGYTTTDFSVGNVGAQYAGMSVPEIIAQPSSNSLQTVQLPSGGFEIKQTTPRNPNINIQTGNVVQMNNTNYVTTNDLQNAVQSSVSQTMNYLQAGGVTYYLD